jgi:dimethylaniline monooxygenase (N-oxide forming)
MVSDTLVPLLETGAVEPVAGIREIRDAKTVELEDGTLISPDCIILCTGYERNKVVSSPVETSGELELSRLYQNIFHPKYADSLAYMNFWHLGTGICEVADLMSMAIAQVFSNRFILPPEPSRNHQIDQHHAFVHALAAGETGPVSKMAAEKVVDEGLWRYFLHEAAGTQVNDMLGYRWQGWKFWWSQRTLCNLLMGGVDTPHVYRLFDGREGSRMKWEGAREAIKKVNEQVAAFSKNLEEKKRGESRKDR